MQFRASTSPSLSKLVIDFLSPFNHALGFKHLSVEVVELNTIPEWAQTDWKIFKEALVHLLWNAIKFSEEHSKIQVVLSFELQVIREADEPLD